MHLSGVSLSIFTTLILLDAARSKKVVGKKKSTTSCMPMTINVFANKNAIVQSPNFPKKFGAQTQCKWIFYAKEGYRVKIHFTNFYLLGANNQGDCIAQFLTLSDSFTGITDGPYCGNSLPPVLISTGRQLVITLESDAADVSLYYRGFLLKASATAELPSARIRDSGGRWREYVTMRPGRGQYPATQTPRTTNLMSRTLDPNDPSAEIEAKNAEMNLKNNQQNSNQQNDFNSYEPILPTFRATRRTTTNKPVSDRPRKTWAMTEPQDTQPPNRGYKIPNYIMTPRYPDRSFDSEKEEEDSVPWIAIIFISLAAVVAIIIFILLLLRRKKRKQKQQEAGSQLRQWATVPGRPRKVSRPAAPRPHSRNTGADHRPPRREAQVRVSSITGGGGDLEMMRTRSPNRAHNYDQHYKSRHR